MYARDLDSSELLYSRFDSSKHDLDTVSGLILDTDIELSAFVFGRDRDRAVGKVKRLISMGRNSYGHENIYVACNGKRILGLAVAYSCEDRADWQEARAFLGVMNACEKMKFILFVVPLLEVVMPGDLMPGDFYISNIVVGSEHRGQGVGSFLLDTLKEQAKREGFKRLWLYVSHDNGVAIRLYEKMGFRVGRKRKLWLPFPRIATYKMELVL
jgi:ribosomal protein S18 acetylase RimI-like enzyme